MSMRTSSFGPFTTLYGTRFASSVTSSKRLPINRLIEYTVFSGFVIACRFATWPTRRSPLFVIATTDGVVRAPSWFGMTVGSPPCITATTELVVPRSIPIILLMKSLLVLSARLKSQALPAKAAHIIHVECCIVKLSMRPYTIAYNSLVPLQHQKPTPFCGAGTPACAPLPGAESHRQPIASFTRQFQIEPT